MLRPPRTARDRFDLGVGQLIGAGAALGESGAIGAAGVGETLTVVGVPVAIATELGAIYVAVGAGVNALEGIYNMATGDSGGGKGGEWAPPAGAAAKSPVRSNRYTKPIFMASGPALARA